MPYMEAEELFEKGVKAVDKGNWVAALACFEKVVQTDGNAAASSYLAVCIARERGQVNKAEMLCREALNKEPDNPVHYLNLGRIYLCQGKKTEAIQSFREGLSRGAEKRIIDELDRLGTRKKPVISFMERDNPVNKFLGIFFSKIRLRK